MINSKYTFSSVPTIELSEDELNECYKLYNDNYGNYRMDYDRKPGGQIVFPLKNYRAYMQEGIFVATARYENELVAHAFYIRREYPGYGKMTWVLQLVVSCKHRKMGIASRLLHSIWGFSDDYAWGLATANPCTVKTLERATYRNCKPSIILSNMDAVRLVGADINFFGDDDYEVTNNSSVVNSRFFVDNSSYEGLADIEGQLGHLEPGYEWLAMTFRSQPLRKSSINKHLNSLLDFSEGKLKEAYSRMDMEKHAWTSKTSLEIDNIVQYLNDGTVMDVGCGQGRHSIELANRGYIVTGIDFVDSNIAAAKDKSSEMGVKAPTFIVDDVRGTRFGNKYDNVICLFDVVGSFPNERDNDRIIKTAYDNLKEGGVLILSVMNMELTESIVPDSHKLSVKSNPEALIKLKASSLMQTRGEVFDGESIIIDTSTGIVYRKEQFDNNNRLSAEYIIRDRRYRMNDIVSKLEKKGFKIVDKKYTCAGFDRRFSATDEHAKELLIVAKKM